MLDSASSMTAGRETLTALPAVSSGVPAALAKSRMLEAGMAAPTVTPLLHRPMTRRECERPQWGREGLWPCTGVRPRAVRSRGRVSVSPLRGCENPAPRVQQPRGAYGRRGEAGSLGDDSCSTDDSRVPEREKRSPGSDTALKRTCGACSLEPGGLERLVSCMPCKRSQLSSCPDQGRLPPCGAPTRRMASTRGRAASRR